MNLSGCLAGALRVDLLGEEDGALQKQLAEGISKFIIPRMSFPMLTIPRGESTIHMKPVDMTNHSHIDRSTGSVATDFINEDKIIILEKYGEVKATDNTGVSVCERKSMIGY